MSYEEFHTVDTEESTEADPVGEDTKEARGEEENCVKNKAMREYTKKKEKNGDKKKVMIPGEKKILPPKSIIRCIT